MNNIKALFKAIKDSDERKVEMLVKSNPQLLEKTNPRGFFPLHYAAKLGDADIVEQLIDLGADVHEYDSEERWTPLCYAVENNHLDVTYLLLKRGAKLSELEFDNDSHSPTNWISPAMRQFLQSTAKSQGLGSHKFIDLDEDDELDQIVEEAWDAVDEELIEDAVCRIIELFAEAGIGNPKTILDCINFLILWDRLGCKQNENELIPILSQKITNIEEETITHWVKRVASLVLYDERLSNIRIVSEYDSEEPLLAPFHWMRHERMSGVFYEQILETLAGADKAILPPVPPSIARTAVELVCEQEGTLCDPCCIYGEFFGKLDKTKEIGFFDPNVSMTQVISALNYSYMHHSALYTMKQGEQIDFAVDSYEHPYESDYFSPAGIQSILCRPPFGIAKGEGLGDQYFELLKALGRLNEGGMCGMILPARAVESSDKAARTFRQQLLKCTCVEAVICLPRELFQQSLQTRCVLLIFSKREQAGSVFFYRDDALPNCEDFAEVLKFWKQRSNPDVLLDRSQQCFVVPQDEIVENGNDLSFARYHDLAALPIAYTPVKDLIGNLRSYCSAIEQQIEQLQPFLESSPIEYEWTKLREIAEIILPAPMLPTRDEVEEEDDLRIITPMNLLSGSIVRCTSYARNVKSAKIPLLQRGDLLIVTEGQDDFGKCAPFFDNANFNTRQRAATVSPSIRILRPRLPKITHHYFAALFQMDFVQRQLRAFATESKPGLLRIRADHLAEIKIPLPSQETQRHILDRLGEIGRIRHTLKCFDMDSELLPESFLYESIALPRLSVLTKNKKI